MALHDAEASEKVALRALEAKLSQHSKQREALERMEREIDEVIGVQTEVESEQTKLKEVHRQLKENQERASRDDGERNDQQHQIKGLSQRNQLAKERIERLNEQHATRLTSAEEALAETQVAWSALEAERSQYSRTLEDNDSIARELRDNLLRGRMEHEAEVASVRQQQQLCVRYGFESAVGLLCFCVALLLPTPESVSRLSLSQACCPSARVPLRSHRGDEDRRRRQPAVARLVSAHRSRRRPSAWPGGM